MKQSFLRNTKVFHFRCWWKESFIALKKEVLLRHRHVGKREMAVQQVGRTLAAQHRRVQSACHAMQIQTVWISGTPPEKRRGNVAAGPMEKKASSSPAAAAAAR